MFRWEHVVLLLVVLLLLLVVCDNSNKNMNGVVQNVVNKG